MLRLLDWWRGFLSWLGLQHACSGGHYESRRGS